MSWLKNKNDKTKNKNNPKKPNLSILCRLRTQLCMEKGKYYDTN